MGQTGKYSLSIGKWEQAAGRSNASQPASHSDLSAPRPTEPGLLSLFMVCPRNELQLLQYVCCVFLDLECLVMFVLSSFWAFGFFIQIRNYLSLS